MSTRVLQWQIQHWRLYAGVVAGGIFGYILFGAVFFQVLAAICLMALAVFTAGIVGIVAGAQRKAALAAQRPDYAAIARMEREIWGETFEHAGAPGLGASGIIRVARPQLDEMAVGDVCWSVPWMLNHDEQGDFWLHPSAIAWPRRGGTAQMRVERRPDGYHVQLLRGSDYDPRSVSEGNGLLVASVLRIKP